ISGKAARGLRARSLLISGFGVRVDPFEDRPIPELAVLRLEDPMSFVWEIEQPRGDPAPLQGGEHAEPLLDGNAEVELALHDQRRCLEALHVAAGGELSIELWILP